MEDVAERPLRVGEAARRLGVGVKTVRAWADRGLLGSVRSPTGQRWIDPADVERVRQGQK